MASGRLGASRTRARGHDRGRLTVIEEQPTSSPYRLYSVPEAARLSVTIIGVKSGGGRSYWLWR